VYVKYYALSAQYIEHGVLCTECTAHVVHGTDYCVHLLVASSENDGYHRDAKMSDDIVLFVRIE